ncbi:MAG: hypothetical protein IIC50_18970 [Planctomycetes bacterium]|nr:hypothetical protein [Planctomycetota bacterium]
MDSNETTQKKTAATRLPLFPEDDMVDGRGEEAADRAEEGQRRLQVFSAIGEYLTKKKRK